MPTATKISAAPEPEKTERSVSLKDPASLVKAYFRLRTSLLEKQEKVALRLIETPAKGLKGRSASPSKLFKVPSFGAKANA